MAAGPETNVDNQGDPSTASPAPVSVPVPVPRMCTVATNGDFETSALQLTTCAPTFDELSEIAAAQSSQSSARLDASQGHSFKH